MKRGPITGVSSCHDGDEWIAMGWDGSVGKPPVWVERAPTLAGALRAAADRVEQEGAPLGTQMALFIAREGARA